MRRVIETLTGMVQLELHSSNKRKVQNDSLPARIVHPKRLITGNPTPTSPGVLVSLCVYTYVAIALIAQCVNILFCLLLILDNMQKEPL